VTYLFAKGERIGNVMWRGATDGAKRLRGIRIEVKARIDLAGWGKPVTAPICLFWTKLIVTDHCSEDLAAVSGAWRGAIEIDASGRLASFA